MEFSLKFALTLSETGELVDWKAALADVLFFAV